jgi:hypothetical protein
MSPPCPALAEERGRPVRASCGARGVVWASREKHRQPRRDPHLCRRKRFGDCPLILTRRASVRAPTAGLQREARTFDLLLTANSADNDELTQARPRRSAKLDVTSPTYTGGQRDTQLAPGSPSPSLPATHADAAASDPRCAPPPYPASPAKQAAVARDGTTCPGLTARPAALRRRAGARRRVRARA